MNYVTCMDCITHTTYVTCMTYINYMTFVTYLTYINHNCISCVGYKNAYFVKYEYEKLNFLKCLKN